MDPIVAYWLLFAALWIIGASFDDNDPVVKRTQPWNWFMPVWLAALGIGIVLSIVASAARLEP